MTQPAPATGRARTKQDLLCGLRAWVPSGSPVAAGHGNAFYVYAPDPKTRELHPVMCWTASARKGCRRSPVSGYLVDWIVPSPDRRSVYLNTEGGVLTLHPRQ